MTSYNKRVYEMLVRILVFAKRYQQFFPKGSPAGQLLDEIQSAVDRLSAERTSQATAKGDAKISTADRALARDALRSQLEAISRTAKALGLTGFWLSRDKTDRSLVEMGHRIASRAGTFKQAFIDSHLPADFIDRLQESVEKVEKTILDQVFKEDSRVTATSAIDEARTAALSALQRLNPLMENLLHNDPPSLRLWQTARRVERFSGSRRGEPDAAAEDPPVTRHDNIAAQA